MMKKNFLEMNINELNSMIDFFLSFVPSCESSRKDRYLKLESCYNLLEMKELELLQSLRR
jgi:hypothetical protein